MRGGQRRARDRALRRQVDDQLPPGPGRPADAADLGRASRADAARRGASRRRPPGERLVLKPLFGAQGRGLRLLAGPDDLPAAGGGRRRLLPAALRRRGRGRLARLSRLRRRPARRGGDGAAAAPAGSPTSARAACRAGAGGGRLAELAVAAAAAVGADHAGVDLIEDRDGGLQVLEVNSMPAWQGLQSVTERGHRAAAGAPPCGARGLGRPGPRMTGLSPSAIAAAYSAPPAAAELAALKPGNVHVHADGPRHDGRRLPRQRRGRGTAPRRARRSRVGAPDPGRGRGHPRRLRAEHQSRHRAAVRPARGGGRGGRRACGRASARVLAGLDRRGRRPGLPRDPARRARRPRPQRPTRRRERARRSPCSRRCARRPGATGSPRSTPAASPTCSGSASRGCWRAARAGWSETLGDDRHLPGLPRPRSPTPMSRASMATRWPRRCASGRQRARPAPARGRRARRRWRRPAGARPRS